MTGPTQKPHGVFITGTDTGVGKTIVTATVAAALASQGIDIGIMKPIATGVSEHSVPPSDADWLRSVTGVNDARDLINPYRLTLPASPLVAADHDGIAIDGDRILTAFQTLGAGHEGVVVEGIGGVLVPLSPNWFVVDMAKRLELPVLVVARARVGGINHSLLTLECLRSRGVPILGLIFNHPDPPATAEDRSETVSTILRLSGLRSFGELPYCEGLPATWDRHRDTLVTRLDVQGLLEALGLRRLA